MAVRGKVNYGSNVPADRPSLRRDALFIRNNHGAYRLRLDREWGTYQRLLVCIGLNPSMADMLTDDPTIRAMYGHCDALNCERLVMLNLFTYVATDPEDLKRSKHRDVKGSLDVWYDVLDRDEPMTVVCAWGKHGTLGDQDVRAMKWLEYFGRAPMCFMENEDGTPRHPLYIKRGQPLQPYHGRVW